jgi:hypothetical protein
MIVTVILVGGGLVIMWVSFLFFTAWVERGLQSPRVDEIRALPGYEEGKRLYHASQGRVSAGSPYRTGDRVSERPRSLL